MAHPHEERFGVAVAGFHVSAPVGPGSRRNRRLEERELRPRAPLLSRWPGGVPPPISGAGPSVTNVVNDGRAGNASSYSGSTLDSISFVAGRVYIISITSRAATVPAPTVSGGSTTWTQVATVLSADTFQRTTVLRYAPASNNTSSLTISFSATQNNCAFSIEECITDNGGTNGSAAIVQTTTASGAISPMTGTLGAFSRASNGTYAAVGTAGSGAAITCEGTWTALSDVRAPSEGTRQASAWIASNDTSISFTETAPGLYTLVGLELAAEAHSGAGAIALSTSGSGAVPVIAESEESFGDGAHIVTTPASTVNGDLLVMIAQNITGATITTPTGWTRHEDNITADVTIGVFWRIASNEPASFAVVTDPPAAGFGAQVVILRITGANTAAPINVYSETARQAGGTTYVVSGGTTTVANCLGIWVAGVRAASVVTFTGTKAEEWDYGLDPGTASSQSGETETVAAAGAAGSATFTPSATPTAYAGVFVAIAPDPARLTSSGAKAAAGSSTIAQGSSLAATRSKGGQGSAATSAATAAAIPLVGALGAPVKGGQGSASITASSSLTASGVKGAAPAASISQGSTLEASATTTRAGTAAISTGLAVDATGQASGAADAFIGSSPNASATAEKGARGAAAAAATASTSAAGTKGATGSAAIATSSDLDASGVAEQPRFGTAAIAQAATLVASGRKDTAGAAAISSSSVLSTVAFKTPPLVLGPTGIRAEASITRVELESSATRVSFAGAATRVEVGGA